MFPHSQLLWRISYSTSLTQYCVLPPPTSSYHLFSLCNVIYPLAKLLNFPLSLSLYMYAFPLTFFPFLCTSIMLPMNVLLPALISFYLSLATVYCNCLSIYIYNVVYVLLPIMFSIYVFLLLTGWKGVRGGLSQLIYHIKYQPSSIFSLVLFPISPFKNLPLLPLFPLTPSFSPPTILHHSFSLVFSPFLSLVAPLTVPLTSPFEPSNTFLKVPISLFFFFAPKQLPYASAAHLAPALP